MSTEQKIQPWYRQFWFWFVMTPLMVVVCVSLTFATVAFFLADDVVVDNYYKKGRAINQSFEQEARALSLGLEAELRFDLVSGEVLLELSTRGVQPEFLNLLVGHPVEADRDQSIRLTRVGEGRYRGDLQASLNHRRYLTLVPETPLEQIREADWLLRGEINLAHEQRLIIRAQGNL